MESKFAEEVKALVEGDLEAESATLMIQLLLEDQFDFLAQADAAILADRIYYDNHSILKLNVMDFEDVRHEINLLHLINTPFGKMMVALQEALGYPVAVCANNQYGEYCVAFNSVR